MAKLEHRSPTGLVMKSPDEPVEPFVAAHSVSRAIASSSPEIDRREGNVTHASGLWDVPWATASGRRRGWWDLQYSAGASVHHRWPRDRDMPTRAKDLLIDITQRVDRLPATFCVLV